MLSRTKTGKCYTMRTNHRTHDHLDETKHKIQLAPTKKRIALCSLFVSLRRVDARYTHAPGNQCYQPRDKKLFLSF